MRELNGILVWISDPRSRESFLRESIPTLRRWEASVEFDKDRPENGAFDTINWPRDELDLDEIGLSLRSILLGDGLRANEL